MNDAKKRIAETRINSQQAEIDALKEQWKLLLEARDKEIAALRVDTSRYKLALYRACEALCDRSFPRGTPEFYNRKYELSKTYLDNYCKDGDE